MDDCKDTLKSLMIYNIYERFNKPKKVDGNNEQCEQLYKELPNYPIFNSLCYKLSRNLIDVCIVLRNENENTGSCEYLNYWLYDLLLKNNMLDNLDNLSSSEIIQKLPQLWTATNYNKKCDLTQYDISASDFNLMKILYDYSFNYLSIHGIKDDQIDNECRRHYCTYINTIINFFKSASTQCEITLNKKYCTIYNEIRDKKNPNKLYSTLNCTDNDIDNKLIHIQNFISKELLLSMPHSEGYIFSEETLSETTPNIGVKIGFSLFVISFISLFLLYKFTPMGSILRNIIRSKLNSTSFIRDRLKLQLLQHSENFEDEKLHNREQNISYVPLGV
ncbi:PIR Superfamily Protein [Plasmodium ovale wallikeri]|uniref:PIR Superfamily Protein n=2 Tax=Plasmodium ovale TaxID=36330 RepID=A0A1A9AHG5_PLAOA|nr:PIR Superfamily Protein [Plasmodium ovale wallikeri]SBT55595.1 PIR Superfamily Protein [Plasmodium ovale wallikeri]SBT72799.1 PIR protein [Plasmodium ovale]